MADTLAARLGDRFRTGVAVAGIGRGDDGTWRLESDDPVVASQVVVTVAPHQAAPLLGGGLAEQLSALPAAPVAVVAAGGRGDPLPPGSGTWWHPGPGGWSSVACSSLRTPRNGRRQDTGWPR